LVQAARRLYNPKGKKLPLPRIVELNRRLIQGYNKYQDEPRIVRLRNNVMAYNKKLWLLGLRDHQVEYAKFSIAKVVGALVYRLSKLAVMAIGTLPGLILFAPVFVAAKTISVKKSREALAASTVKLQGKDVMATWKLLVAMALAPTLYTFYISLLTWWTARNRIQGIVPTWVPLWLVIILGYIIFPMVTFAALRIGETGMDILKSLRPLVLSLNPTSANTLHKLRDERERLSAEVTEVINTLGPEMFDDFETARLIADPFKDGSIEEPASPTWTRSSHNRNPSSDSLPAYRRSRTDGDSTAHDHLPRNESFGNLGNLGLFATRPPSRSRSRDSSTHSKGSHGISGMTGFSMIKEKTDLEAVSDKIRGAMRERGKERRRMSAGGEDDGHDEKEEGWEITGSREGLVEGDGEDKKHI
jgi:glycerol-3-phosphate O-acyltransferase/dihydroxyacetone phosphate acyltransferase